MDALGGIVLLFGYGLLILLGLVAFLSLLAKDKS